VEAIPLPDGAVDIVMAITAPRVVDEALHMVRRPGWPLQVDVAPEWYGGDLAPIIQHPVPDLENASRDLTEHRGCSAIDCVSVEEYGTQDNILRTYGFIFDHRVIAHLKQAGRTTVRWRFRIHCR
jgi:hypothetical protein